MWFAWIVAALAALAAIGFAYLWQRARAHTVKAEIERQAAERAARAAERELQRHVAQLAALNLAQTDAVLLIDAERVVVQLNVIATGLFGPKAAPGQTLIVATRSVELDELADHVLKGGEDHDRQITLNGLPYRARAVSAGAHGLAIVLKDLSELQRLGRSRRDFIANISHELRTPLTSIRLLVESLLSGVARDPHQAEALTRKIQTEVQVLEQMAQELLDLAQIESGQSIVRLLPTPVDQLVHTAVERLRPQAEHKRQQLSVVVPGHLIALADAAMLSRVLGNLLHNAIKFTPPDGAVLVQAQKQADEILIRVADTGPGIPPADLPRVFERFFRGDRSRQSSGTGLGLAIAKHVVEAHGGRIWAENHGADGYPGAAFNFTLLTAEEAA